MRRFAHLAHYARLANHPALRVLWAVVTLGLLALGAGAPGSDGTWP
jgi:hypothetical protein